MASARIVLGIQITLSNYQYHLKYKCGEHNANADGLSRLPLPTTTGCVPVLEEAILAFTIIDDTPVTAKMIAQWTARDPILAQVCQFVLAA